MQQSVFPELFLKYHVSFPLSSLFVLSVKQSVKLPITKFLVGKKKESLSSSFFSGVVDNQNRAKTLIAVLRNTHIQGNNELVDL